MNYTAFLQYLAFEKRLSPHTLEAYRSDLEQFSSFLKDIYDCEDPTLVAPAFIRSWMVQLLDRQVSTRSIQRKLATLKSYFRFLLKRGVITANPMLKVLTPKAGKRLPVFVEAPRMEQLFTQITFDPDFKGRRDRIVLELLYGTGMRRSELLNLHLTSFDKSSRTLRVLGKGNKERFLPVAPYLHALLETYIDVRNTTFPDTGNHLILTDQGKPAYPKLIYLIVNRYLSMVTTADQRSPHVLRHSFATHLTDQGAELNAVKDLLGHASLAATQIYTHNSVEKLRKVYAAAHPKAGKNPDDGKVDIPRR